VKVRPTKDFLTWFQRLPKDHRRVVAALLTYLSGLDAVPSEPTAVLQPLVQANRYPLWRIKHPHHDDYAYRLIVWFSDLEPGVAYLLFGGDKTGFMTFFTTELPTNPKAMSINSSAPARSNYAIARRQTKFLHR
jgi:hypothetical protein